jgi:hypothetical protein
LPKSVEEALEIDRTMNTDLWRKAINKEMSRVKIAWKAMMVIPHNRCVKVKYPNSQASRRLDAILCLI